MKKLFFLLLSAIAMILVINSPIYAECNKKCQKKVARTVKSYTRAIEKAESKACNTDRGKTYKIIHKSCSRSMKSLDKRYDKFKKEVKAHTDIKSLRKRHVALKDKLPEIEKMAKVEKVVKPYRDKISRLEKSKNCKMEFAHLYVQCLERVQKLESVYNRIGSPEKKLAVVVKLRERHDKLIQTQKEMQAKREGVKKAENDKYAARSKYYGLTERYEKLLRTLSFAKADKPRERLHYIEKLDEQMDSLKTYAEYCDTDFKDIVAKKTEAKENCKLAKNRVNLRNKATVLAYQYYLEQIIAKHASDISTLNDKGSNGESRFDLFLREFDSYFNKTKNKIVTAYKSAGAPAPTALLNKLKKQKSAFKKAIKKAVSKNSFDDSNLKSLSGALESLAERNAKEKGLELEEAGITGKTWYIQKNALGIPLNKSIVGLVVLKHPKESFCRMLKAKYVRTYDGNHYVPASQVIFDHFIMPIECP